MTTTHHEHQCVSPRESRMGGPVKIALLMVAVTAGIYLLREHWGHVTGNWIYLLLLACALMHVFHGHGGHGNHGASPNKSGDKAD